MYSSKVTKQSPTPPLSRDTWGLLRRGQDTPPRNDMWGEEKNTSHTVPVSSREHYEKRGIPQGAVVQDTNWQIIPRYETNRMRFFCYPLVDIGYTQQYDQGVKR
jgi:hypothetical protein